MTRRSLLSTIEGAPVLDGSPPRVLVVDDSASLRAAIAEILEAAGCVVVGRAMDGAVALRLNQEEQPDVITLDLEMPRMDGFTFLRILQKQKNTPVIVITSDARPEAALMALELGARDFVVKPSRAFDLKALGAQLVARVKTLAALNERPNTTWAKPVDVAIPRDIDVVCLGCSTGGPRALRDVLARLEGPPRVPLLIAQHMPPRFTEAFAQRLAKATGLDIKEAHDGEQLLPGMVRIAPGGMHLGVAQRKQALLASVVPHDGVQRWVPSVDHLFLTAATVCAKRVLGVVLTGMGRDGADGAKQLAFVGAPLWTESPLTAAVDGMPAAAAQTHGTAVRMPLDELATALAAALRNAPESR